ncbi:hypothetical protein [Paraburkholderia sediminicola]|uniref:hypothetical protein n=1 Tax=Paraburkholderia sediminicola TaxID=458836 RepID=UPI0038BABC88
MTTAQLGWDYGGAGARLTSAFGAGTFIRSFGILSIVLAGITLLLRADEIAAIYARFVPGGNLADDFFRRFGQKLDEDELNQGHQLIILAASLDDSTERIVGYLNAQGIPINVLCFQVFANGGAQLLSRSWLLDPVSTQTAAVTKPDHSNEVWNGEFYCSYGDGDPSSGLRKSFRASIKKAYPIESSIVPTAAP